MYILYICSYCTIINMESVIFSRNLTVSIIALRLRALRHRFHNPHGKVMPWLCSLVQKGGFRKAMIGKTIKHESASSSPTKEHQITNVFDQYLINNKNADIFEAEFLCPLQKFKAPLICNVPLQNVREGSR